MQDHDSCRFCGTLLTHTFVDLGMSPLCESYLSKTQLDTMEPFYPLHVFVCENCFLVQLKEYVNAENIFTEYAYFSSYSQAWLDHSKNYVTKMIEEQGINDQSLVVELASNDGYLLQYFQERKIPVLGIEPAKNVAEVAIKKGINTHVIFFNEQTAKDLVNEGFQADLLLGNNVLAQVPDLNSFVKGMKIILKDSGFITMEFPHLMTLMAENQFDTIYHEHFSYFSFFSVEKIFNEFGLELFDVEEIPTHGGSLRIYAKHTGSIHHAKTDRVDFLREKEKKFQINDLKTYAAFAEQVKDTKRKILQLLIDLKKQNKVIAGYGAPGKGNTLLNYCGIRNDMIDFTVDRNPYKHDKYLPGTHIPIFAPEYTKEIKPDYIFILPWNFKEEIIQQEAYIKEWGGRFIVPIPNPEIIE
jgi:hypothetical protein